MQANHESHTQVIIWRLRCSRYKDSNKKWMCYRSAARVNILKNANMLQLSQIMHDNHDRVVRVEIQGLDHLSCNLPEDPDARYNPKTLHDYPGQRC